MSRRNIIKKYQVFTSANTTTNPASIITDVSLVDNIVYQLTVDPSVNAFFAIKVGELSDLSDGKVLSFGLTQSLVGATDTDYMIAIQNKGFKWMRIEITNNGGTGNINGWISANTVGA